ncbi:MAG: trypsin-like peptidase domain-containing protein [Chloroflexota bacterium]|nr:trypsin-like peptidase domain-containing protein [Chloroflexota bacterium]
MRRVTIVIGVLLLALFSCVVGWGAANFAGGSLDPVAMFVASVTPLPMPSPTVVPTVVPDEPLAAVDVPPNTRALLQAEQEWLDTLYREASPSVVNITSRSYTQSFFFDVIPQEGTGSGFIWDEQGHIVTNYHVIEGSQELEVTLADGRLFPATVVGVDPANDLAIIHLDTSETAGNIVLPPPLPLGDSLGATVGQRVVAIGNPFGYERTLTTGVVSALGRVIQSEGEAFIGEVIQHDAAINPGNSGGPLLDLDGQVIGINTQIVSPSGASAGIGFAIPADTVTRVVPELIARGHYPHPWLGIEGVDITPGLAARLQRGGLPLEAEEGVLIQGVYRGGPAENVLRGGVQRVRAGNLIFFVGGDLLVALDDQPIPDQRTMYLYLEAQKRVGDPVRVQFWRDGELQEVTITLAERPQELR